MNYCEEETCWPATWSLAGRRSRPSGGLQPTNTAYSKEARECDGSAAADVGGGARDALLDGCFARVEARRMARTQSLQLAGPGGRDGVGEQTRQLCGRISHQVGAEDGVDEAAAERSKALHPKRLTRGLGAKRQSAIAQSITNGVDTQRLQLCQGAR